MGTCGLLIVVKIVWTCGLHQELDMQKFEQQLPSEVSRRSWGWGKGMDIK